MRVYFRNQHPLIDHFAFKCSSARGEEKVANGEGEFITDGDGYRAVHLFRTEASRDDSWIDRLEAINTRSASVGMPYVKIQWPESVKTLRAQSLIPNARSIDFDPRPEPIAV